MKRMIAVLMLAVLSTLAHGQTRIAVGSSFESTAGELAEAFFERTDERIILVAGSSTNMARQVREGTGFDAFISSDIEHARQVAEDGPGDVESLFVFGIGRLVLLADENPEGDVSDPETMLREESYRALAVPDDRESAYGKAAEQVLDKLFRSRFAVRNTVEATSAGQAFSFMRSGSVDLGFVPLSLVVQEGIDESRYWVIPQDMHDELRHAAIMLEGGSETARRFLDFIRDDEAAHEIIRDAGYTLPDDDES